MSNILARKDGRTIREIPQATNTSNDMLSRKPEEPVEHDGLNTILNCRWCGEKVREVYVPQYKDGENGKPVQIIYNYEPCAACKKLWAGMVVIIEVTDVEPYKDCLPIDNQFETNLYPTGRHVGVTEAAAKDALGDKAKNGMVFFMEHAMFDDIFKQQFEKK